MMRKSYIIQEKEQIINRYRCGKTTSSIHERTGIARNHLYNWIEEYNVTCNNKIPNI